MIRMKDIAEAAGVSRTTVSFILNDSPKAKLISEATRKRVLKVAQEMGYRRNELARAVATGRTRVVGLISRLPQSSFSSNMLSGLIAGTDAQGYLIKFIGHDDNKTEEDYLDIALAQRLSGVITIGYAHNRIERLHDLLAEHRIPYCVLANSFPVRSGLRVISDDVQGGMLAVDHLVENGHRLIGFIGHNPEGGTSVLREQGYLAGMEKHGLEPVILPEGAYGCLDYVRQALSDFPSLSAVFTVAPNVAAVAIKAARQLGRAVPEELSVVGYAHTELTEGFDPKITTISQHHFDMGHTAATALAQAIEARDETLFEKPVNHLIPVSLVPGESVAYLKSRS